MARARCPARQLRRRVFRSWRANPRLSSVTRHCCRAGQLDPLMAGRYTEIDVLRAAIMIDAGGAATGMLRAAARRLIPVSAQRNSRHRVFVHVEVGVDQRSVEILS